VLTLLVTHDIPPCCSLEETDAAERDPKQGAAQSLDAKLASSGPASEFQVCAPITALQGCWHVERPATRWEEWK